MFSVSTEEFQNYIESAIATLSSEHREAIKNVAFFVRENPSEEQLQKGGVQKSSLLLGLYEGIPLAARQGKTPYLPDTITIFQHPIEQTCATRGEVKEQIRHTVWHEIAHYFGLNHDDIHSREV